MSSHHLSCQDCRIRLRASAPEIALLDGRCPICGATLAAVPSASGVVGLRSFDLDLLSEKGMSDRLPAPTGPADLAARREVVSAQDRADAERWSDEGGSVTGAR